MTKNFNAKQFIKQYPKELHPISEEKMKCCNIISAEWLRKLEKSLKNPFSHIPKNFGKSIEDLVDSDGKLLHNVKRGADYELVTNFMFDNLSCLTDKDNAEVPRGIRCGLGHDPTTGEEVVVFDLVAFNIKMVKCNKNLSSTYVNLTKTKSTSNFTGERWYASASWTFQDFLRQYCEIVNLDESTHGFYQDATLGMPIKLNLPISKYFKGCTGKITAHDLYFGSAKRTAINKSMNTMVSSNNKNHSSIPTNEKSLPTNNHNSSKNNNNINNESSASPNKSSMIIKHNSVVVIASSSSSSVKIEANDDDSKAAINTIPVKTDESTSTTTTTTAAVITPTKTDYKNNDNSKENFKIHHARNNSVVFQYRFSPSNDLILPKLEPTGFINLSNSSYMNAVIQCFIRIPPVASLYFGDKYADYINESSMLSSQGNISKELHKILNDITSIDYNPQVPYNIADFRTVFINQYNTFDSNDQQNAREFLKCLIDGLHEDINQAFSSQKSRKKVLETLSPYESPWEVCLKLNKSLIYDIFLGMVEKKYTCQVCSHTEMVQEPFVVLSLPLPSSGMHFAHLEDCLKHYCQKELLTKRDKIECKKCQRRNNTKKTLKIEKCGQILIIELIRFETSRKSGTNTLKKNDINISYPRILNMNPYSSSNNIGKYKLIGCVYHYGSPESGHYAAASFDQIRDTWYTFDDTTVGTTKEKNVHNSNAYLLFYQKE